MQKEQKQEKKLKIQSGIRAGFWVTFGAGLGDLQIVPVGEKESLPKSATFSSPTPSPTTGT